MNDGRDPDRSWAAPLSLEVSSDSRTPCVTATGDLDLFSASEFQRRIDELAADQAPGRIALDLAGVGFVDSTGLGVLVTTTKAIRRQGGDLVLRHPTKSVQRLLEVTGMVDYLTIEE